MNSDDAITFGAAILCSFIFGFILGTHHPDKPTEGEPIEMSQPTDPH